MKTTDDKQLQKEFAKLKELYEGLENEKKKLEAEKIKLDGQKRTERMTVNELEYDKKRLRKQEAKLQEQNLKLEKINHNLSVWQNAILHEQKNMFSEIYNHIYSIKNNPNAKNLEYVVKKTEVIEQEFNSLLKWSKSFVRDTKPEYQYFQFCSIIENLSSIYEYYAGKKEIKVTPQIMNIHSDKVLLRFIFHNIIKNVLNIVRNNAVIDINISKENECYRFEITDNGPGFFGYRPGTDIFGKVKKGNGMMIIEKCIEILNGQISLYNLHAGGCKYDLKIPTNLKNQIEA